MNARYDFHIHTNRSDGRYSAYELLNLVSARCIEQLAITDHDTFEGYRDAMSIIEQFKLKLYPGIELSTSYYEDGQFIEEIHILAYALNPDCETVRNFENELREMQNERVAVMLNRLSKEGYQLDFHKLVDLAYPAPVSLVPIITQMVIKGYLNADLSIIRAFVQSYFTPNGLVFEAPIPRLESTITRVKELGGLLVFAHPCKVETTQVKELLFNESHGIEVFYSDHSVDETLSLCKTASQMNKLMTIGTDFHGHYESDYVPIKLPETAEVHLDLFITTIRNYMCGFRK